MQLTTDIVEGMYNLLLLTPPFRGWRLPPSDDVVFGIMRHPDRGGDYCWDPVKKQHKIQVNDSWCGNLVSLVRIVAHEMVHLHLQIAYPRDRAHHGRRFLRCAAQVCRHHHLDPKAF